MAERVLVGWNFPNLITIPTMALGGFLLFALIWQVIKAYAGGGEVATGSTGY